MQQGDIALSTLPHFGRLSFELSAKLLTEKLIFVPSFLCQTLGVPFAGFSL